MDPEERARREQDRVIRSRERLKFRVFSVVRDLALGTDLFRSHFQLHEPDIIVNVYSHYVDVVTSLNEAQLHVLPVRNRTRELNRFGEQLRTGMERIATGLDLKISSDPAQFGGSEPVILVDAPIGYRAVLLRSGSE
ncbi:MAG: hypothetical protein WAN87_03710 [Thermoplasmata archaeon]